MTADLADRLVRRHGARARRSGLLACVGIALLVACATAFGAPRASLPAIERQVMCVTCKIPLNVAESPQADRERAFIQSLIDRGEDEAAIKHALVGQYGPTVLALPSDSGFDAAAYIVPLVAIALLVATLVVLLPRWRRRARAQAQSRLPGSALSKADAQRLDADLERFD